MLENILELLNKKDYFGVSKNIDIAKGLYKIPKTIKDKKQQIKREKNGKNR
ncbi:MAG: hypothetical protein Unbinned3907contig1000_3 [Prokaryotic dsDNA virus sp.]|nr:MAG: hypothetical protein Unbinned3907contig1000_3 [Prokaryotic dsDNA virus sp.]|tara:strand:+ start:240 stop:392 length:153 start_codon:yes stop_codon:yes gene_type:complete